MRKAPDKAVHFIDGEWLEGNPAILGPLTHATWMASVACAWKRSAGHCYAARKPSNCAATRNRRPPGI